MPRTKAVLTPAPEPPKLPVTAETLDAAVEPYLEVSVYDFTEDLSYSESF